MKTQTTTEQEAMSSTPLCPCKPLLKARITFEDDLESWIYIANGLNSINCMSAQSLSDEMFLTIDDNAYVYAMQFIKQLNESIFDKILE